MTKWFKEKSLNGKQQTTNTSLQNTAQKIKKLALMKGEIYHKIKHIDQK